jgi:C-terminal processing protease CtpA/Prc
MRMFSQLSLNACSGVGLFFQQDVPGIIFVSSVVPGAAAARSGIVKKGDIVVKVNYAKCRLCFSSVY